MSTTPARVRIHMNNGKSYLVTTKEAALTPPKRPEPPAGENFILYSPEPEDAYYLPGFLEPLEVEITSSQLNSQIVNPVFNTPFFNIQSRRGRVHSINRTQVVSTEWLAD